jgi:peptidoglycan/xylan/chitin deacetylase (PgdA/CDA1 family)
LRPKDLVARAFDACGLNQLGLGLQRLCLSPYIRVLYAHDVPPAMASAFEAQLAFLQRHFVPASREDLVDFLQHGRWRHRRPGIIITFDDGLRSNYEIAAPALEKYGFQGWFFVPIGLLNLAPPLQPAAAERQWVTHSHDVTRDPRVFMNAAELRDLARRHVIGCHTIDHVRLSRSLTEEELDREILEGKAQLETALSAPVDSFAWVGGEEWAYSAGAARRIASAFDLVFTTNTRMTRPGTSCLQIDRTQLEAYFPMWLTRFQLCGFMDLFYARKRSRVGRLFVPEPMPCA